MRSIQVYDTRQKSEEEAEYLKRRGKDMFHSGTKITKVMEFLKRTRL